MPKNKIPRNVWIVTLTSFLTDVSSEMLSSLLPVFLFSVLGVRTTFIGIIEGIAEATASLFKLFSGWLSDKTGKRKNLAVFGYSLSALAKPFLWFVTTWAGVLVIRFADRMGKGLRTSPRDALISDSVEEEHRGFAFGLHRAGDTAGAVVGIGIALIVIVLAQKGGDDLTRSTFQTIVLVSVIPAFLAVLVLSLGAVEIPPQRAIEDNDSGETNLLSLPARNRRYRAFLLISTLFMLGNFSDAFLILRANSSGLGVVGILLMMMTFNLVYALISTPAGAVSDRLGRRRVLIIGWVIFACVYLGFAFTSTGWQSWLLMAVYGCYYGLTEGVSRAYIGDLTPSQERGSAYGLYYAVIGVMAFPASFLAGVLWQGIGTWDGFGEGAPFVLGACTAILAALLLMLHPAFKNERAVEDEVMDRGEPI
jgi:MFS family permease